MLGMAHSKSWFDLQPRHKHTLYQYRQMTFLQVHKCQSVFSSRVALFHYQWSVSGFKSCLLLSSKPCGWQSSPENMRPGGKGGLRPDRTWSFVFCATCRKTPGCSGCPQPLASQLVMPTTWKRRRRGGATWFPSIRPPPESPLHGPILGVTLYWCFEGLSLLENPNQVPSADHVRLQPLPVVGVGVGGLAGKTCVTQLLFRKSCLAGCVQLNWQACVTAI